MSYKQQFAFVVLLVSGALAAPVVAQDPLTTGARTSAADTGFYGGVVLRQGPQGGSGVQIGNFASAWGKFVAPTADETASRALFFGGYRWANDLAFEAAFATADRYALAPAGRGGVGLAVGPSVDGAGVRDWNADVYTSWAFRKSFALYGRLGYAQSDAQPAFAPTTFLTADPRRPRDGMNYGVGLRYDVTRTLGLRLEYARFGRFAGESVNGLLPESDQVQFGMQFRF